MKLLQKVFSIKNDTNGTHKIICILGIKIKVKRKISDSEIIRRILKKEGTKTIQGVQRSIVTAIQHQKSFGEYKNKHHNQDVVLVGAGPTLNKFKPFKGKKIYVGCNRAFMHDDIIFDYLFSIDKVGLDNGSENYYDKFFNYRKDECVKFIGDQNINKEYQIPESQILKYNVKRYKTTAGYMPNKLYLDIDSLPLANFSSVSLQAMQFILYTNPAKVYLVGIDCTAGTGKHFTGFDTNNALRNENGFECDKKNISGYENIKEFAQMYYPETEIISINPVGLKGIFKDIYTNENGEYVDENNRIVDI